MAALLAPAMAAAQPASMTLPAQAKERGIRSGDFTLHPSLNLTGHHDTNLFNVSGDETIASIRPATSLRVVPKLALSNDASNNVAFTFESSLDARIYISDVESISAQTGVGGAVHLDAAFGARKALAFSVFDNFNRSLRANNWDTKESLNSNANEAGVRVEFHPGEIPERRPLNVAFMAAYAMDRFDNFSAGQRDAVRTRLTGSWRFLPKTAAVLDSSWDFSYLTDSAKTLEKRGLASSSQPFRAKLGLAGALTKRISLEVGAGWGLSNHDVGESYNSFLAGLSIGVRASETTRLLFGYTHDFRDAFFGNYVDTHRIGTQLRQRMGSIMDIEVNFAFTYAMSGAFNAVSLLAGTPYSLKPLPSVEGSATDRRREDKLLEGSAKAVFEVSRMVGIETGYALRGNISKFALVLKTNSNSIVDSGSYFAHEIYASAVVRY
ncbi:MAG: hypothetical protein EXR79_00620 [Myxococcales bacterium]|nr:hypothetical protein [Myxococcales bacterium]